jgi:hypothetical protein
MSKANMVTVATITGSFPTTLFAPLVASDVGAGENNGEPPVGGEEAGSGAGVGGDVKAPDSNLITLRPPLQESPDATELMLVQSNLAAEEPPSQRMGVQLSHSTLSISKTHSVVLIPSLTTE